MSHYTKDEPEVICNGKQSWINQGAKCVCNLCGVEFPSMKINVALYYVFNPDEYEEDFTADEGNYRGPALIDHPRGIEIANLLKFVESQLKKYAIPNWEGLEDYCAEEVEFD